MNRYVGCVDLKDAFALGVASNPTGNVRIGVGAGRNITTGMNNIILGANGGDTTENDTIVLSGASTGLVCAKWDGDGNLRLAVRVFTSVPAPPANYLTVGYDATRKLLVFRHNDGTGVYTSAFHTDAEISALAPLTETPITVGTMGLIRNAAARQLRRLRAGANMLLVDGDPDVLELHAANQPLQDATASGVSLVHDAAARVVKRLDVGTNLSIDTATDPTRLILSGPPTALASSNVGVGAVSLVHDAAARVLRTIVGGANMQVDDTSNPGAIVLGCGLTKLDHLSDAISTTTTLTLGLATPVTPAVQDVAVGPAAMETSASGGSNTAVGFQALRQVTGSANVCVGCAAGTQAVAATGNVIVGGSAGAFLRNGGNNVYVGRGAGPGVVLSDGAYNACVGDAAGPKLDTGHHNAFFGSNSGGAVTTGARNVCIGCDAGNAITTGSGNVIVGAYTGSAAMANTVVVADGNGTVRAQWVNAANGVFGCDTTVPALSTNNTMSTYWIAANNGVGIVVRDQTGISYTVEVFNERPLGTAITTATSTLSASHRNRFTLVNTACTITLSKYTNIVLGAEHEFMNNSTGVVGFLAGTTVIKSTNARTNITVNGVAVVKYIADNTFLVCGSLE